MGGKSERGESRLAFILTGHRRTRHDAGRLNKASTLRPGSETKVEDSRIQTVRCLLILSGLVLTQARDFAASRWWWQVYSGEVRPLRKETTVSILTLHENSTTYTLWSPQLVSVSPAQLHIMKEKRRPDRDKPIASPDIQKRGESYYSLVFIIDLVCCSSV